MTGFICDKSKLGTRVSLTVQGVVLLYAVVLDIT